MTHPSSLLTTVIDAAIAAGEAIMDVYSRPESDWQVEHKSDDSPLTLADRRSHRLIADALAATPYPLLSEEGAHEAYAVRRDWRTLWVVDPLDGTKEFIKRNGEFTVNIALVEAGRPVLGVIYVPVTRRLYWGVTASAVTAGLPAGAAVATVDVAGRYDSVEALPLAAEAARTTYVVVASRSHLSAETQALIDALRTHHPHLELRSAGSSLKLCLVAAGTADIYPRLAPTMEWDTAAGHAIAVAAGCEVVDAATEQPVVYNKEDLHNPYFIVRRRAH
jgi:3'(2'), 5'-bisphosphate nucleotidase